MKAIILPVLLVLVGTGTLSAQIVQTDTLKPKPAADAKPAKPAAWYEKISLRGYTQVRYNRLLETNPDLKCEQCDRSIGKGQGVSVRRGRLILSGDVHDRLFIYIQSDYSADAGNNKHYLQLRDAYFDYSFDKHKKYRVRIGQSKVPFGFENLQSSQNRLPLDRSDALNSAAPNERDMGAFFMYSPAKVRAKHREWAQAGGLKGSGDYGMVAFGVYNGQGANKAELNDNLHLVGRISYPFTVGNQTFEPGLFGYTGKYTFPKDQLTSGVKINPEATYTDRRVGATLSMYANPIGFLAEYNIGQSPSFDVATDSIVTGDLKGGFVTIYGRLPHRGMLFHPFVRFQTYDGAKKLETDARYYRVDETELGVEWQIVKNAELTVSYVISDRKYNNYKSVYAEQGRFLRIQMQFNY